MQWLNSAEAVAFNDCDIKTYDENILIKLFYPLLNDSIGYSFLKAIILGMRITNLMEE